MKNILYKYVDVDTFLKIFAGEKSLDKEISITEITPKIKLSNVSDFRYNDYEDGLGYNKNKKFSKSIIRKAKKFKKKISNFNCEDIDDLKIYDGDVISTLNELNIFYYSCIEKRNSMGLREKRIKSDYHKIVQIYSSFNFCEMIEQYFEMNDRQAHNFRNKFAEKYGVFCLTKNENNLAMWSHYCKNGGFVIAFDINHDFFRQNSVIKKIKYSKVRPTISLGNINKRSINKGNIHPVFYTKDVSWSYEKEYRAFFLRNSSKDISQLSLECIKGVFVGFAEYPLSYPQFVKTISLMKIDRTVDDGLRNKYKNIMRIIYLLLNNGIAVNRLLPYGKNGYSKLRHHKSELSIEY